MNIKHLLFAQSLLVLLIEIPAEADSAPVPVSPGSFARIEQIADVCPTFSWGGVPGATGYELEVYVVSSEDVLGERIIHQRFNGTTSAWTPPLRRCFTRTTTYAWSVGAMTKAGTIWSDLALFQVAQGHSDKEFQEALRVVRSYLEANEGGEDRRARDTEEQRSAPSRAARKPKIAGQAESKTEVKQARPKAGGSFAVDGVGNVMASAFIGNGAELTEVDADTLDSKSSTDFLLTSGGTVTGDLIINGTVTATDTISAPTLNIDGEDLDTVTEPTVYTPAFLTCGTNAEGNSAQWASLASGTFRITLESISYDIIVNFVGVMSMAEVAAKIQDAINAATSGSETVTWNSDHFQVTSGDTTINSSITPLETHGSATPIDISGAGVSDWMDCDNGNSAITKKELNTGFYAGSLVRLDSSGLLDTRFMPNLLAGSAVNQIFQESGSGGTGAGIFTFDIPIGFSGATRFQLFYHMTVRDFGGSGWLSARTGLMEGALGGAIVDILGQTNNTTNTTIAQNTEITWTGAGGAAKTFFPLQVQSTTTLTILSIEAYEQNVRLTLEISNIPISAAWLASLRCISFIAYR